MSKFVITALVVFIVLVFSNLGNASSFGFDYTHQIFHFHGTDTASYIGSFLKGLGDINGDGYDDIAISSKSPMGTYIFLGGNPPDTNPDYFFTDKHGHIVDFMDYSGDGLNDLIISANDIIYLFLGDGTEIDTIPADSIVVPSGFQYFRAEASAYINDNSIGDLLVNADDPLNSTIQYLFLDPFVTDKNPDWTYALTGFDYSIYYAQFIDFNGDNIQDISMSMWPIFDSLGYAYLFFGPDYGSTPDVVIGPVEGLDTRPKLFARGVFNVGDINGDGWEDLGLKNWSTAIVYFGGPTYDTIYDCLLDGMCNEMSRGDDINGDGYNDLLLGGSDTYDGRVILYLGGPSFDCVRDDQIDRHDLPPLFLDYVGRKVASAGDINGDGFNDVLFSCRNFIYGHPGDVFVFSGGADITVDIENENELLLPDKFTLYQNYPNPFNQSTVIKFELHRKAVINLEIYNNLGQKIASLIKNQLYRAGRHKVTWDGCLSNGNPAPTGVYFYKISGDRFDQSKRMLLLK